MLLLSLWLITTLLILLSRHAVLVIYRFLYTFKIKILGAYFSDSAEASELDKVKQATAEQEAKSEQRRMKFQAQDSVLAESLTYDWAASSES